MLDLTDVESVPRQGVVAYKRSSALCLEHIPIAPIFFSSRLRANTTKPSRCLSVPSSSAKKH